MLDISKRFTRQQVHAFVAILVVGIGSMLAQHWHLLSWPDRAWLDAQFSTFHQKNRAPLAADPVIIGIDQAYIDSVDEPLALMHRYLAETLNGLAMAKPAVVAIDLSFPGKRYDKIAPVGDPTNDYHRRLMEGLAQITSVSPLVLAQIWNESNNRFEDINVDFRSWIDLVSSNGSTMASSMLCTDADLRIRNYPGPECQPEGSIAFAAAVAAAQGKHANWGGLIDFGLGDKFPYIGINEVRRLANAGDVATLEKLFQGRAVFIGGVFENDDVFKVPVPLEKWHPASTDVHGVLIHAQIYRNIMNNRFIYPLAPWIVSLSAFLGAFFWFGSRQTRKVVILLVFVTATLTCSVLLFRYGTWFPPSACIAAACISLLARAASVAWGHFLDKRRLQRSFAGYVSPAVMSEIVSGRLEAKQNERRYLVVMFSDVRNFTTLSEKNEPDEVVSLLTRYFDRMVKVIHRHQGTLDKFMGDGIMVFFGAPNQLQNPESTALECAEQMLVELAALNAELAAEGRAPLAIGIGINSGEAIVGNIGAGERHEYTAIGDTVNTAARLESLSKDVGYPIICSEKIWQLAGCPAYLQDCGEHPLKGRSPMRVFGWKPAV